MLREVLARIRDLGHVSELFTQLGYSPTDSPHVTGHRVVARWRGFLVVGAEATEPREAVRALARKLGAGGERALAVALGNGQLVVAAPHPGVATSTRLLAVSLTQPSSLGIDQLSSLRPKPGATALAHALAVVEVLSAEVAGDRFFAEFRSVLDGMAASLDRRRSASERSMAALLALTRVLFLYFIQAKGWLAGDRNYLRGLLDQALGDRRHFHRTALEPLCFGTLNRPPRQRTVPGAAHDIPYLNGGLFEPHPVERRIGPVYFSNELWQRAFECLFDRFRFCVRESDEVDAIAPDMLGRVFERLMRPAERAKTGTFYTPESVVHGIVERAVTAALPAMGVSTGTVEQLVQGEPVGMRERQIAGSALRRLRILDPAVGSGAFLLGALHLLTEIGRSLEPPKDECAPWRIRRRVLRENLFGVDLNPLAVRLSELRLWLAVVADDPTTDIARISPLPNLDGVVRQGNTLLDPIGTTRVHHTGFSPPAVHAARQVRSARERVFETRGRDATRALGALRAAEVKLAQATLEHADRVVCHALQELNSIERGRDLFGRRTRLSPSQRSARRSLEQDRTSLRHALTVLRDGTIPFFSFEVHAPEVMAAGGFHVVVGNPPWVRAERLSPDERAVLRRRFSWWRARTERGFAHLPDLALAFLERALELTAPGGTVGFLLPSKVTSAAYGHTARQHLVRETTITYLHRIPDREAQQFGATTYPLALVLRNEPPSPGHTVPLDSAGQDGVAQAALAHSGPWILVPDRARDAIEQLRASGTPLREVAAPALGVKTGADQVLTGTLQYESDGIAHVQFGESRVDIESAVLRPALRGRDVLPFDARPSRVVLWGLDGGGRPTSRLPERAANHVSRYRERLCARTDYRGGPSWTLFRTRTALAKHRVVWRDIARRPCAVTLEHTVAADAIPLNSCYVAGFPDDASALAATAVLNSTWAAVLAAATADEARGGYRRINARVIGEIPVVTTGPACASLATLSAAYHRSHHAPRGALDEAVAQALGLPGSVQECLRTLGARNGR